MASPAQIALQHKLAKRAAMPVNIAEKKRTQSPAERRAAKIIQQAPPPAPERDETSPDASKYEILLAQIWEHQKSIGNVKPREDKNALKAEFLKDYDEYINDYVATVNKTGKALQDDIFMRCMIWNIDIENYARGLEMAEIALKYGLKMPQPFTRDTWTYIAEDIAKLSINRKATLDGFPIDVLLQVETLVTDFPLADQARATLYKAIAQQYNRAAENITKQQKNDDFTGSLAEAQKLALNYFLKAQRLWDGAEVKKEIERLAKKVVS